MIINKRVWMQFAFLFVVLIDLSFGETLVESNAKFQEFVQIQNENNSFLCGGIVIDSEFVATASACLDGKYAHQIKDGDSDGYKLITKEYRNVEGLALLRLQPVHTGNTIPTGLAEPALEQRCTVIGWDHDPQDNAFVQSLIEVNYTYNFFDTIIHQQFDTICEFPTVKAVICNGFVSGFIVKKCNNGQPSYSHIEMYKHNEWIKKIFKCAVNHEPSCDYEVENISFQPVSDYAMYDLSSTTTTTTTTQSTTTEEYTTQSTTTTTTTTEMPMTTTKQASYDNWSERSTMRPYRSTATTNWKFISSDLILFMTIIFSIFMF